MTPLYYYNGNVRWSFFWENPNYWATFLVFALVGLWTLAWIILPRFKAPRFAVYLVHAFELPFWFLIAKSYSRGGLLTAIFALVLFFILQRRIRSASARIINFLARLVAVGVICLCVGFSSRLAPDYVAQDRSVLNRLDMWQGALVMMKDSPWTGWGNNNGGFSYINWYQPQTASARPVGFVNSYLDVAVELGVPMLFLALGLWFFFLLVAWRHKNMHETLPAFVILAAWGLANVWTSLWRETSLWIVPAGCVFYLLAICFRSRRASVKMIAPALASACVTVMLLWALGAAFSKNYEWIARPDKPTGRIMLQKRNATSDAAGAPEALVDGVVFGRYFGKTFRIMAAASAKDFFVIHPPWIQKSPAISDGAKTIIFSGFQLAWLAQRDILPSQKVVIIYPTVHPPFSREPASGGLPGVSLYIPAAGVSEYNLPWRRWAERNDVRIARSPQAGLRIDPERNIEFWRGLLE